jgi:hypothetical protein
MRISLQKRLDKRSKTGHYQASTKQPYPKRTRFCACFSPYPSNCAKQAIILGALLGASIEWIAEKVSH